MLRAFLKKPGTSGVRCCTLVSVLPTRREAMREKRELRRRSVEAQVLRVRDGYALCVGSFSGEEQANDYAALLRVFGYTSARAQTLPLEAKKRRINS